MTDLKSFRRLDGVVQDINDPTKVTEFTLLDPPEHRGIYYRVDDGLWAKGVMGIARQIPPEEWPPKVVQLESEIKLKELKRTPPAICSQADLAEFFRRPRKTSGFLKKLSEQGFIRHYEPVPGKKYRVWLDDPDMHKELRLWLLGPPPTKK
jgi:hypothetical protein